MFDFQPIFLYIYIDVFRGDFTAKLPRITQKNEHVIYIVTNPPKAVACNLQNIKVESHAI